MQFPPSLLCRDDKLLEDASGGVLQLTEIGGKTGRRDEVKLQEKSFVGTDLKWSLVDNSLSPPASIRRVQQEGLGINLRNRAGRGVPGVGNGDGILIRDDQQQSCERRYRRNGLEPAQPSAKRRNGI